MPSSSKLGKVLDISLVVLFISAGRYMDHHWHPVKTGFYCDDRSILHEKQENTVTPRAVASCSLLLPVIAITVLEFYILSVSAADAYDNVITFFYGASLLYFSGNLLKFYLGMHRPYFLEACRPKYGKTDCSNSYTYVTDYECQGHDRDASRSFPSLHSAVTSFGMLYSIAYIQKRFITGSSRHRIWTCLQTLCVTWAVYVPFTRILDRRHHLMDVIAGCIMGTAMAIALIFQWTSLYRKQASPKTCETRSTSDSGFTDLDTKNR